MKGVIKNMKEQFLNLSGLTELVTYIKLCIAQHKMIIPRASFSLFPKTGDENNIYIDTSTNSIYRWNDSDKSFVLLAKPPRNISISEGKNNGQITLKVDEIESNATVHGLKSAAFSNASSFATSAQGAKADSAIQSITIAPGTNNGTVKITVNGVTTDNIKVAGLGSAAFSDIAVFAPAKHTHSKSDVGLGNVDNTADIDKSVKYAGSSGSSNTVVYTALTNTDLNTLQTEGKWYYAGGGNTCTNVPVESAAFELYVGRNASGWRYQQFTVTSGEIYIRVFDSSNWGNWRKLAFTSDTVTAASSVPWSGITGKPTTFTPASHTHNYAGSSSAGGTANASYKLSNVGQITTVDALNNFNEANVFKYATMSALDGLNGLGKNDGIILSAPWSSANYGHQIFLDDNSYTIAHRYRNSGTWSAWKTLIDSSNIGSQSVNYANSAGSVAWTNVSGKPSTYAPSSHTHTKSQITDFPSSLPASDVYAWAKASSKPSYSWGEITGKPSTFAPSSHTHNYAGSSSAGGAANSTNAINWVAGNEIRFAKPGYKSPQSLHIGWAWSDGSKIKLINEYIFDGGDGNKTQVTASQFNGSLNGNASSASSVAWTNVSGRPSSLPASDVYSWAKASSKPSYSWSEITSKPSTFTPASHTHAYIPLSGGTITGSIIRSSGGSWISARNNVAVRGTATGKDSWNPVVGQATPNGYWTIGNLASNDNLAFSYTSNTNYNAGNNSATTVYLPVQEGTIITSATIGSQSVKYATSAGSAGSVAWGNVSGKPSSYTPSSHTHDDRYYTETEINTKLGAKLGAVSANGYYGMARPDGNTSDWIRTTTAGIIPYQSGGAGAGHCGLGTSSWYFSNAYIDTVNCVNTNASGLISTSSEYRSCKGGEVNRDWRFGSATGSGDQNWFGFYDYTYGYHGGIYGPGHSLRMGGEIQSTAANGFRAVQGKYGFIIRNDGANVYFMMTGNGDPWGGWNDNYTIFTPNGEWQVKKSPYDNGMSTARGYVVVSDSNNNRVYSISNYNANYLKVRCGLSTYHCTYSNSDIRLKKNINNTSITNALSVINSIKVRQFDWKETNIHQSIGFVADELEKLDPNFSQGGGVTKDGGIDVKSVNSFYLQGYIVKALQELSSQVSDLKQENKRLKQKLNMCN